MVFDLLARSGDSSAVGLVGALTVELSFFEWLKLAVAAMGFVAGVAVWVWGRDRAASIISAVAARELDHLTRRLDVIDTRLDQGRAKLDDILERIQSMLLANARTEEQLKEHVRMVMELRRQSREDTR